MSSLADLYQSLILDHNRSPRNYGAMADADRSAAGRNPLCGDELTLWIRMDGETIADVRFEGSGCAISKAAASLMTTSVKGKTRAEATVMFGDFHDLVTGKLSESDGQARLGRLAAFGGVSRFPARVKCASMAWHTLKQALEDRIQETGDRGEG